MATRINHLHHSPHEGVKKDLIQMLLDIPQYATADLDQDKFNLLMTQWIDNQHEDPQELQSITMSQEHQAHIGLALANTDEYRTRLQNAHSKGLRGLFRTWRQKDIPWQRPFQELPLNERLQARQEQWGAIWQPVDEPCPIRGFRKLREDAMIHARTMQSINPLSLQRVIKKLPNKAAGPDGISYDFLRQLPFEAVTQLLLISSTRWRKKPCCQRKCAWSTS